MNEVMIGALSGVVASLIGAAVSAWMSYRFQDKLLDKQMQQQRELMAEQNKFQEHLYLRGQQDQHRRDFENRAMG
jgi:hypothetical protein